ncbi:MAG: hypothetical protein ABII23_03520, partial [bacterium]
AFRIARIQFINSSPTMKNASETTISVIVESMKNNYITVPDSKGFSPIAQTAIAYEKDVLEVILKDPAFKTYDRNIRRLLVYYEKVMHDEIKTVHKFRDKLDAIKGEIRDTAVEFSEIIDSHTLAMEEYRNKAMLLRDDFMTLGTKYRELELTEQLILSPKLHEIKEDFYSIKTGAEKLHAQSINKIETVLAPGDPGSARKLMKKMRDPLNEISEYEKEISLEFEILSHAGGEIQLLRREVDLLQWKIDILAKDAQINYDYFHRGILLGDIPSFDAGDASSPLTGRPSLPHQSRVLAYSFQEMLRIYGEYDILTHIYEQLDLLIGQFAEEDIATSAQQNSLHDAQYILNKLRVEYVESRYFDQKLYQMRQDLLLYGIDEQDLLDMARGRSSGIDPAFIETIEGQGIVPATK